MLKSQEDDDGKHNKHHQHQPDHHHHSSTSFESDAGEPLVFTRIHRNKYRQQTTSGRKHHYHHHRKEGSSSFRSFGSGILNFINTKTTTNNKQQQHQEHHHQHQHHQHRRSPTSSIFNFGSTIIQELTHDFTDYQESESIALNALFSIAQPIIITAGEDHYGEEQEVVVVVEEEQAILHHPTLLDKEELITATVLIVEEELDYGDLKWSLLSNTFFIFGGFYESMDAIWDILDENGQYDTNNYHPNRKSIWSILRIAIGLLGPLSSTVSIL